MKKVISKCVVCGKLEGKGWRREHLTDLHEFHQTKLSKDLRPVQIGDVVTVYNESKRRGEWRLAVIKSLIKESDNVVRGANI